MIEDVEKINIPGWVWRHYSLDNTIEMLHLIKRLKNDTAFHLYGFAVDKVYSMKPGDSFSVEEKRVNILDVDIAKKYNLMNNFTETRETIKAIFKSN